MDSWIKRVLGFSGFFRLRDALSLDLPLSGLSVFNRISIVLTLTKMAILYPRGDFIRQIRENLRWQGEKPGGRLNVFTNMFNMS